jgi:hypothetical protein
LILLYLIILPDKHDFEISAFPVSFSHFFPLFIISLQAVESLEERIKELKTEKRFGTREIDKIESEMTEMRNEVTRLRRQYLNYFYYF